MSRPEYIEELFENIARTQFTMIVRTLERSGQHRGLEHQGKFFVAHLQLPHLLKMHKIVGQKTLER